MEAVHAIIQLCCANFAVPPFLLHDLTGILMSVRLLRVAVSFFLFVAVDQGKKTTCWCVCCKQRPVQAAGEYCTDAFSWYVGHPW